MKNIFFKLLTGLILTGSCVYSADADKAKELKLKIADAEKALSEMKSELAKLEEPSKYKKVDELLSVDGIEIGTKGPFLAGELFYQEVSEILSGDSFLMKLDPNPRKISSTKVIVKGVNTKGFADGYVFMTSNDWKVVGTEKIGRTTYFVLRPDGDIKIEKKR
jgi:hypothetical protein